ncbi:hypothetical protein ES702_06787 [subsurface metagenome]
MISTSLVSVFLMALIWQLSEMGAFRDMTSNFVGKIVVCFLAYIVAQVVGAFLSGGK